MRSLVTRVILLVHNQGTRLSWKITWENSWQHCPWPVSRHQRQKIKKEVSKGCICLKRNADLLVTHSMALGGLKKGLYPAPRKSSISPPDTDRSGWSILSFASGSKTSVQSTHTILLRLLSSLLPHLWRMELHNTGHVFLSTETPFEATEVFQGSLSLRTHGHLSHCPGANFCCCPLSLNLVSRYNIPVFSKESQGPTAVYWVFHQVFRTYDHTYPSSPAELQGDSNITDIEE